MKKKAIEKIPYLKLAKTSRKKDVKYIGVTAIKIVQHEKHLFLEIYRNDKNAKDIPAVRIVLTKKDFGTYFPETGEWSKQKILSQYGRARLIWCDDYDGGERAKENIIQSDDDLERIRKYCKTKIWNEEHWWEYIEYFQDCVAARVADKARQRKYQKRQKTLRDRIRHTKSLPEKKILDKADEICFSKKHYLYYKKHGAWATIACSKCGGVTEARWKDGISYESQFQGRTEEPREGNMGCCPLCGAQGEYKCQGKVKGEHSRTVHLFLGQKYKEQGMVIRYIEVRKTWKLGEILGEKGMIMQNACEELSGTEIARAYFEPGERCQIDYHKHSYYSGEDFWDDCNLYGLNNIEIKEAMILQETYEEMKGTMFQYSALRKYAEEKGQVNVVDYLKRYQEMPQIEMLVKLGMTRVVDALVKCWCESVADAHAKTPEQFLGIRKERVKQLIKEKGNIGLLKVMQMEMRMQQVWTDNQIECLKETGLSEGELRRATRYMSLQKLLNYIEKYAGCEYGTGCAAARGRIRQTAIIYMDYIGMAEQEGCDLTDDIVRFPKDMKARHNQLADMINARRNNERMEREREKYAELNGKIAERLLETKRYFWENKKYMIIPAGKCEELIIEGQTLHHCVGSSDTYMKRMAEGTSWILFLRKKEDLDKPYYTIEIDMKSDHIMQYYSEYDRKPDKVVIEKILEQFKERVRRNREKERIEIQVTAIA